MCPLFGDDTGGGKPLYLQLRDKLRRAILSGELPAGKLPSARDMAHLENVEPKHRGRGVCLPRR